MKITFESILKCYLVVLMVISLLIIVDRLTEQTSKPIILSEQIGQTILIIHKGCIFPHRIKRL